MKSDFVGDNRCFASHYSLGFCHPLNEIDGIVFASLILSSTSICLVFYRYSHR